MSGDGVKVGVMMFLPVMRDAATGLDYVPWPDAMGRLRRPWPRDGRPTINVKGLRPQACLLLEALQAAWPAPMTDAEMTGALWSDRMPPGNARGCVTAAMLSANRTMETQEAGWRIARVEGTRLWRLEPVGAEGVV
jgi:hypothetical protein